MPGSPLIAFLGLGSAGSRLLKIAREQGCAVVGYRRVGNPLPRGVQLDEADTVGSIDALLARRPQGIVIASPTARHAGDLRACASAGVPMLVEKPIATSVAELDALLLHLGPIAGQILVGYNLRFIPGFAALADAIRAGGAGRPLSALLDAGGHLGQWRPWAAGRSFYSARRADGGGVLLDLSHELDAALAYFGRPRRISAVIRRLGDVTEDTEDIAAVQLDHGTLIAEVHVDYLRRPFSRSYRIACEGATLRWTQDGPATVTDEHGDREIAPATAGSASYDAEMRHFLACVRGDESPRVTIDDARAVLEVVDAARTASERGSWVDL